MYACKSLYRLSVFRHYELLVYCAYIIHDICAYIEISFHFYYTKYKPTIDELTCERMRENISFDLKWLYFKNEVF